MTYRYNLSIKLHELIENFSKDHKEDNYELFNYNFKEWVKNNKVLCNDESQILKERGFNGDFTKKLFKSSRYYFTKKKNVEIKKRKKYIVKDRKLLELITNHIQSTLFKKPSIMFNDFVEKNKLEVDRIKNILTRQYEYSDKYACDKIKKIYKNKYYTMK
tara:strand:- start:1693 stop:2172 length:480 start_codon:yes stop_codon:yes gene_type:complete